MTHATSDIEPRRDMLLKQLGASSGSDIDDKPVAADGQCLSHRQHPLYHRNRQGPGAKNVLAALAERIPAITEIVDRQSQMHVDSLPVTPREIIPKGATEFTPKAPTEFTELHLHESEIESLVLKFLMHRGLSSGRDVALQLGLSFVIIEKLLHAIKVERLVVLKSSAALGDFNYELTEAGLHRARKYAQHCSYFGSAPVTLGDYSASVAAQSLQKFRPKLEDLRIAFADLTMGEEMFRRVGRAITAGMGLFLHGPPGNGKTSIAERVTRAYGTCIWIPRAISAWGEIIRIFDPSCHEEMPSPRRRPAL